MLYRYAHIIHNIHTVKAKFDKVILTGNMDVMWSIWKKNVCVIQQHLNILCRLKEECVSPKQLMKDWDDEGLKYLEDTTKIKCNICICTSAELYS